MPKRARYPPADPPPPHAVADDDDDDDDDVMVGMDDAPHSDLMESTALNRTALVSALYKDTAAARADVSRLLRTIPAFGVPARLFTEVRSLAMFSAITAGLEDDERIRGLMNAREHPAARTRPPLVVQCARTVTAIESCRDQEEIVRRMLAYGADPTSEVYMEASRPNAIIHWNACDWAAFRNRLPIVRIILESDPPYNTGELLRPLLIAAMSGCHDVTHYLCEVFAERLTHDRDDPTIVPQADIEAAAVAVVTAAAYAVLIRFQNPTRRTITSIFDNWTRMHYGFPFPTAENKLLALTQRAITSLATHRPAFDPTRWPSVFHVLRPMWLHFDGNFALQDILMRGNAPFPNFTLFGILIAAGFPVPLVCPLKALKPMWWDRIVRPTLMQGCQHARLVLGTYIHEYGMNPAENECCTALMSSIFRDFETPFLTASPNMSAMLDILFDTVLPPYPGHLGSYKSSETCTAATNWIKSLQANGTHRWTIVPAYKLLAEKIRDHVIAHCHTLTLQERCIWALHRQHATGRPSKVVQLWEGARGRTPLQARRESFRKLPMPLLADRFRYILREFDADFEEPEPLAIEAWMSEDREHPGVRRPTRKPGYGDA